jgi:hypothetical protein
MVVSAAGTAPAAVVACTAAQQQAEADVQWHEQ